MILGQDAHGRHRRHSQIKDPAARFGPQEASHGLPPLTVFPQDKRELAEYDVLIFMDVDPTHPRMAPEGGESREKVLGNVESWVKRSGGLILHYGTAPHR